ncbi:hypothetical protein PFISCL1PPCAC_9069, partial [Pristionchus fissidentatus]
NCRFQGIDFTRCEGGLEDSLHHGMEEKKVIPSRICCIHELLYLQHLLYKTDFLPAHSLKDIVANVRQERAFP